MQVEVTTLLLLLAALPAVLSLPWEEWRDTEMLKQSLPMELKIGEEIEQADTQSAGTFSGCYSDTNARILEKAGPMIESDMNINADCEITCKEKGYTVASTRGRNCYCTNSLPLPQLYRANDSHASGNSGPCSTTCPGAWTEENCQDDECCGGENAYSVFIVGGSQDMLQRKAAQSQVEEVPKHFQVADIQSVGKFDGCYSDNKTKVIGGASGLVFKWNNNYNAKCQLMCQEKGYAIASTKGSYCYCTYSLPLPPLARADNKTSAGNGGPCSTVCPGVFTTTSCRGDECCGGTNATSVYIVGQIDALKQLERRVIDRVVESPKARKVVYGSQGLNFHYNSQWKLDDARCTYTLQNLSKSGQVDVTAEFLTTDFSINFKASLSRDCNFKHVRITTKHKGQIKDTDKRSYWLHLFPNAILVPKAAIKNVPGARGTVTVVDVPIPKNYKPSNSINILPLINHRFVRKYVVLPLIPVICSDRLYPEEVIVEARGDCPLKSQLGVSVVAMGLTATKNGVGGIKVYNLTRLNTQETLTEIPRSKSPLKGNQKTDLKLINMEKLLESNLAGKDKEKPLKGWDIACDNTFGSDSMKCKKDYTETSTFEESWSTEHGFDLSVSVGAEFEAGALFTKAKTTFQVTAGYSFSKGYTETKSKELSATFGIEGDVPKGARMEVRFFKSNVPVQVKWRASIFADGYVLVMLHDPLTGGWLLEKPAKVHLSQLLTHYERTLFAFGTINYGKRSTLIARTKVVDRSGKILSSEDKKKPVA